MNKKNIYPSTFNIRKFTKKDLPEVIRLIHKTIDISYTPVYPPEAINFFREEHSAERIIKHAQSDYMIVLEITGKIVATGQLIKNYIGGVYVDPDYQNQKLGRFIMDHLIEKAIEKNISNVILNASLPSFNFYSHLGFQLTEKTFHTLKDNSRLDYFKMEKKLI